jgi:glutamate 5-kinase
MVTKLIAADLATSAGVSTIITLGSEPQKIIKIINEISTHQRQRQQEYRDTHGNEDNIPSEWTWKGFQPTIGTHFLAKSERMIDRKWWIAHGLQTHGSIYVDQGAVRAIRDSRSSLFAAGIVKVEGIFSPQQSVRILFVKKAKKSVQETAETVSEEEGVEEVEEIGKGIVNYSSTEINRIKGCRSSKIEDVLGYMESDCVIHRNNLAVTGSVQQ